MGLHEGARISRLAAPLWARTASWKPNNGQRTNLLCAPSDRDREPAGGKKQIVITEIPYQIVKSRLVTCDGKYPAGEKVDGIAEVRDESGREGHANRHGLKEGGRRQRGFWLTC